MAKLQEVEAKLDIHIAHYNQFLAARDARHDHYNKTMLEMAEEYNKLDTEHTKVKDELHTVKLQQAAHSSSLTQFGGVIARLEKLGEKIANEVGEIKISLTKSAARDTAIVWIGKLIFQMVALAGTIVGIFHYI